MRVPCLLHVTTDRPEWSSGSPRMLLLIALVREFESRRGETLNLFAKIKQDQQQYQVVAKSA